MAKSKNTSNTNLSIGSNLQIFYCLCVSIIVLVMVLAFKTSAQVWSGIHDTLVYKDSIVTILAGLSAICVALIILKGNKFVVPKDKLSLSLYALVAFAALSFFWAERPGFATHKTLMWASSLMVFFLCMQFMHNERLLHVLLRVVFIAGVIVAVVGLMQYFFNSHFVPQATPPASTFSNKNMACHPIILSMSVGIYLIFGFKERSFFRDLFYGLGLALMLMFVFHTQTRAAWLAMFVELIFIIVMTFLLLTQNEKVVFFDQIKRISVGVSILFLILGMSLKHDPNASSKLAFTNPATPIFQLAGRSVSNLATTLNSNTNSFEIRKRIWAATAEVIEEKPLMGQGMGNFYISYTRHHRNGTESIRRAHNDYLEMIAEIGFLGFAIFSLAMLLSLVYLFQILKSKLMHAQRFLLVCIASMLLGTGINAFFSFPYFHITPAILMGIYLAVIVSLYHQMRNKEALTLQQGAETEKENNKRDSVFSLASHKVLSIALLVILIIFSFIAIRAKYYVEHLERVWSDQIEEGEWKHMDLGHPRWLETTHYNPVLYGMYGALRNQANAYANAAKSEQDFSKRLAYQKEKARKEKLFEDIALNANEYRPQLSFLINLAYYYLSKGDNENAKVQLQRAEKYKGIGNLTPDFALLNIEKKTNGDAAALAMLDDIVSRHDAYFLSKNDNSYLDIGFNYYRLGNNDKALEYFKKSTQIFPQVADAYKNLAVIYMNTQRMKEAVPYMQQYIELPNAAENVAEQFKKTLEDYNKKNS